MCLRTWSKASVKKRSEEKASKLNMVQKNGFKSLSENTSKRILKFKGFETKKVETGDVSMTTDEKHAELKFNTFLLIFCEKSPKKFREKNIFLH